MPSSDVLVVGKGNAALCAALAARDGGASVRPRLYGRFRMEPI